MDFTTLVNPKNEGEKIESRLWPDHCVQDTPGAAIIPEINTSGIHYFVKKGTIPAWETYSGFYAPFKSPKGFGDTGLREILMKAGVEEVWVVGLATDYCVRSTAEDAVAEGFTTFVVEDATKAVDPTSWETTERRKAIVAGVKMVSISSEEIQALGWTPESIQTVSAQSG